MKEKHLILTFLGVMIARARRISIFSALLYVLSAAMLGISSFSLLLFFRGNKEEAVFGLIASGFLAFALFLWSLRHWFRDSSYLFHAQNVERAHPQLRGSLLCSLELEPDPQDSIGSRVIARAQKIVDSCSSQRLVSYTPLKRSFGFVVINGVFS